MSKLWIKVDYLVAASIIKGLRGWLDKLSDMLDAAKKADDDMPAAEIPTKTGGKL